MQLPNYLSLAVESGHYLWYAYFSSDRRNRHSGGIIARMGAAQVVVEHWLAVSVSVQAVFIIIMTALSTKYLDPQNERFKAGNKILKKHKSQ